MTWKALPALLLAGVALAWSCQASAAAGRPGKAGAEKGELVYLGTHGTQLRAARFDPRSGAFTEIGPVAEDGRPTWAVAHPHLPVIYVTDEAGNDGLSNGHVLTYRIDPGTGALTLVGKVDAGGGGTTFLSLDPQAGTLVAANYGGGSVATFPVQADGTLGPRASLVRDQGSGPHRRQKGPHAHAAMVAPGGKALFVADLGADRVFVYPFDAVRHEAQVPRPGSAGDYVAPPGSGPRHMAAARDGRFLYLLDELNADLVTLRWDAGAGRLSLVEEQPTRSADASGDSSGSEIAISRDGRFLYAGNRSEGMLLIYALDKPSGKATLVQRIASGGKVPWSFALSPDGRWMLVANEQSDEIRVFAVDARSGRLTATDKQLQIPRPVSITFASVR